DRRGHPPRRVAQERPVAGEHAPACPVGRLVPAAAAAAGAGLPHRPDAAAVHRHAARVVHELERLLPRRARLRRSGQLRPRPHRRQHEERDPHDHRAHRHGRARQPRPRPGHRAAAGPAVPRSGDRAHDDDRAVPRGAGGGLPALEARSLQPRVRPVQRPAHRAVGTVRVGRPAAGRLDLVHAADRHRGVVDLAVDAVHDAHPAGRAAGPSARRHRGGQARRRDVLADLPLHDLPAPAPVPRAGRAARCHLRRAELRRRLHDHLRRARHLEPALHDLPDLLQRPRLRPRLGRRGRGRHRHDHHRDVRPADRVHALQGGVQV
ncbi:MAG: Various polyols ABC transporter, permease protein 1, partial [uncultured Frankineae bacterium]